MQGIQDAGPAYEAPYCSAGNGYLQANIVHNCGAGMGQPGHGLCPYCPTNVPSAKRNHRRSQSSPKHDVARGYVFLNKELKPVSIMDGWLLLFDS